MLLSRYGVAVACLAIFGCATRPAQPPDTRCAVAEQSLSEARFTSEPTEQRIAYYLQAAAHSAPLLESETDAIRARETYDAAAAELTALLLSAEGGRWWNRSESVSNGSTAYQLRFAPGMHDKVWDPDFFTSFMLARKVNESHFRKRIRREGVGGELVGVRHPAQRDPFMIPKGIITAPVTAVLAFHGRNATLSLQDPRSRATVSVDGAVHPLAADFSAPFGYYRPPSNFWMGLMAAFRAERYMDKTGLFFTQPYDPDRIPVIFVHGLISTPQMWIRVANEVNDDPVVRARYQYWVFGYPSGNPLAYSALRLRDDLAKLQQIYPGHQPIVLIGHSMGGLVSQMQVTTIDANPHVRRVVFISTPHRGSNMAISSIGAIAMSMIVLPSNLVSEAHQHLAGALPAFTGNQKRLPNSIFSLSPKNPTLLVMDKVPIKCPYHSIIGDRGKGNSPNSTDGVVPYWSSHLDGAQSELIVPSPHGCCELPQTIQESRRILLLNLNSANS